MSGKSGQGQGAGTSTRQRSAPSARNWTSSVRGDVYRLKKPRSAQGHEQQGERYAVVVQANAYDHLSTWLVTPTTTKSFGSMIHPHHRTPRPGRPGTRRADHRRRPVAPRRLRRPPGPGRTHGDQRRTTRRTRPRITAAAGWAGRRLPDRRRDRRSFQSLSAWLTAEPPQPTSGCSPAARCSSKKARIRRQASSALAAS